MKTTTTTTAHDTNSSAVFDRRFIAGFTLLAFMIVMAYLFCVTFVPVASGGAKYADMIVPLLLGTVIGGIFGFLYGASKQSNPPNGANVIPFPPAPTSTTVTSTGPALTTEVEEPEPIKAGGTS